MKKLLALGLVIFTSLLLTGCGQTKPEDVAKNFYQALEDKNVDKAYDMLYLDTKASQHEMETKGKLQMIVGEVSSRIEQKGGTQSIEVGDVATKEDNARVQLHITFKNKTQSDETFNLRKQNDEWKIRL